jgi:plastocyanin domain-containing protein
VKATRKIRRLRDAFIFAAIRGAATAVGSGLIGLAVWWLTHH